MNLLHMEGRSRSGEGRIAIDWNSLAGWELVGPARHSSDSGGGDSGYVLPLSLHDSVTAQQPSVEVFINSNKS